ncbi:MAG: DEAD/DEAH box helicase family protein [Candidatus Poribacteria bacterium]|nr:DEAD/DEAH box helicase family protein [Candidatus Poribacteria bacterium]
MSEAAQTYFALGTENEETHSGFYTALNYIQENANTQYGKGNLFERLIRTYLLEDPFYQKRFSEVYLWSEWAELRPEFDGVDIGIDLVAQEHDGGYCAIQCKCYAENTRISKKDLDTFISASAREPFTARIFVDTARDWSANVYRTLDGLQPPCQRISAADLASRPVEWPDLSIEEAEQLDYRQETFSLREHQREAFNDVINGFRESDRGKLIMACGTGKTFAALRIAEHLAGVGGRVLYLVPSIGLFAQAMREWSEQQGVPHRYIGICSDTKAGKTSEDASILELEIPVTTDPADISKALQRSDENSMQVVFCTYHSLPIVEAAQDAGAPPFDIVLCDEAHRTTGIEDNDDKTSPFVLVHNADRIRAKKRLYMTATSRLYTEGAKAKAAHHDIEVFSMDDPATYGPEFHRLPFSRAVEQDLLSDYKVVVLAMSEQSTDAALQTYRIAGGKEININDATKIVGCWRALQNPERKAADDSEIKPLTRAIAFTNTIAASKNLVHHWNGVIESAIERMPEDQRPSDFACETDHVDGKTNALNRKKRIEWLKGNSEGVCRILSNARCLSEGIDVPALDAVLFMSPRNSHVDIVQAVGRVMRKAEGKQYGYIVFPVAIPAGADPADILNDNERFASVWNVLRALRSHDDRLNAEINRIDLNTSTPDRIIFTGLNEDGDGIGSSSASNGQQLFLPMDLPPDAIFAKIVEKCGDRKYWESWAKDVADIFLRVVGRIESLLDTPENDALREWFDDFHSELKSSINDAITRSNAIDMMAQHILTRPVFEALFENYDFASGNPVAIALDKLRNDFAEFGLEDETRDLEKFYESVRMRARGIDNSEGRQRVLLELYEKFFATALKKDAERLGIVYTPVEVVDFILHSANEVLQDEFGKSLSDEGVHILDPFTGAGIFLARLLQSGLIQPDDLERKYRAELHANEIVLLAYYIAAVNIEEAFRGKRGQDMSYEPFNGIVLTDTFNLNKERNLFPKDWLPDNNERAERQQQLPIGVIVGNPPWSAGQKSAADDNPNVEYPELKQRIRETYAEHSTATLKRSLYDTYKMAIRWASDRIEEQGIVAFVTNGSWIDGNVDAGIRACLAEEFSSIHVLNLRGNQRTQGEVSRREGGKIFGSGSRAPVAITFLVKNPNAKHEGCKIHYHDIGDYLTREEKLEALHEAVSIKGFSDWQKITPDKYHDWIGQRNDTFSQFYPLGSEETKAGKVDEAIFRLYSRGYATGRDAYIYNFSHYTCAEKARRMTQDYINAFSELETPSELSVDEAARLHSSNLKWDFNLKENLKRKKETEFEDSYIRKVVYRPFIATNCYANHIFAQRKYQQDRIFPDSSSKNRVICVPGLGSKKAFSALITDAMPDLGFNEASQCFPRYQYPKPTDTSNTTGTFEGIDEAPERIDNISDTALRAFREHYGDGAIAKDDIFDYVYGVLHAPSYREEFANDLSKMIPRIPYAPDFHAFAEAGAALANLHLNYETCEQYRLELIFVRQGEPQPTHFRLTEKVMRFVDKETKTTLIINEHIRLSGIPEAAHRYVVNGRTPLEWFIDRYKITTDKDSGIVNDPNGWFADPRDLIPAIERIVYVSVESARIIEELPSEVVSG